MENAIKHGYRYYTRVVDELPSYMAKNLQEMPNNKGYYWRGVTFYGELPQESETCDTIIFEKKNNKLLIHQYKYNGQYVLSEKFRTNRDDKSKGNRDDKSKGNRDDKSKGNRDDKSKGNRDDKTLTSQDNKPKPKKHYPKYKNLLIRKDKK